MSGNDTYEFPLGVQDLCFGLVFLQTFVFFLLRNEQFPEVKSLGAKSTPSAEVLLFEIDEGVVVNEDVQRVFAQHTFARVACNYSVLSKVLGRW